MHITTADKIYIVTNGSYAAQGKEHLPEIEDQQILCEPSRNNTAPCVAYTALRLKAMNKDANFVVAPSDHVILKEDVFINKLQTALDFTAKNEALVTLGIRPTRPDTGYGYIQYLEDTENKGFFKVKTFTEKPNLEVAKSFLESGDFVWNGGIFLFSARTITHAFRSFLPDMADQFTELEPTYYTDKEQVAVNETYGVCKNISIDYGIMEKAENVYTVPTDFGWSDLGTWTSVHENTDKDYHNNAVQGEAIVYDSLNNMIKTTRPEKLVVVKGLEGYIIVDTDDALLICKKEDEQFIKQIVGDLKGDKDGKYV